MSELPVFSKILNVGRFFLVLHSLKAGNNVWPNALIGGGVLLRTHSRTASCFPSKGVSRADVALVLVAKHAQNILPTTHALSNLGDHLASM